MKSDNSLPRIDRRTLVSGLALLPAPGSLLSTPAVRAQNASSAPLAQNASSAPLASWTGGPAKQAIIDFVHATTPFLHVFDDNTSVFGALQEARLRTPTFNYSDSSKTGGRIHCSVAASLGWP